MAHTRAVYPDSTAAEGIVAGAEGSSALDSINRAIEYQKSGKFDEAESICRHVLSSGPKDPNALHLLGKVAHGVGQLHLAMALLRASAEADPANPGVYESMGLVMQDLGNGEVADGRCASGGLVSAHSPVVRRVRVDRENDASADDAVPPDDAMPREDALPPGYAVPPARTRLKVTSQPRPHFCLRDRPVSPRPGALRRGIDFTSLGFVIFALLTLAAGIVVICMY
jgi:tetratricopeptide (TPR) repeat protein